MKRLIITLAMFGLLFASQTNAQQQWQSYRKTRPIPALQNPTVAKIVSALGVPKGPPIEPDRTITLDDATMSLIGPLAGEATVYRDLQIPRSAIVYVEGRVDLKGSYSLGQGVIVLRHPNSWLVCRGGQGELGQLNGKLVQILGGGPSAKWAGLSIVDASSDAPDADPDGALDAAHITVHEVVIAGFGLRKPGIEISPGDKATTRLEGDHLYVTNNRNKGLFCFGVVGDNSIVGAEINLRDSWIAVNDSLDLGLTGNVQGEFTDSHIGDKVWLFDDEGLLPGEGRRDHGDPGSQYSQGAKVIFNNSLPAGLLESLNKRIAEEPNLANLLQFTEPRPGRATPAQIWPTQAPLAREDFNANGQVDLADLAFVVENFGGLRDQIPFGNLYDINGSGQVDMPDLTEVIYAFAEVDRNTEPVTNLAAFKDIASLVATISLHPAVVEALLADPLLGPVLGSYFQPIPTAVMDEETVTPVASSLDQNYPNPFNPTTTIRFDLVASGDVQVLIYNISGQLVKTLLANTRLSAGSYHLQWDGDDSLGLPVASGTYVCVLNAGNSAFTKKMLLLR